MYTMNLLSTRIIFITILPVVAAAGVVVFPKVRFNAGAAAVVADMIDLRNKFMQ